MAATHTGGIKRDAKHLDSGSPGQLASDIPTAGGHVGDSAELPPPSKLLRLDPHRGPIALRYLQDEPPTPPPPHPRFATGRGITSARLVVLSRLVLLSCLVVL